MPPYLLGLLLRLLRGLLRGLVFASVALAVHGYWQDHYRGADHLPCCGPHDCQRTHLRILTVTPTMLTLEIAGAYIVDVPQSAFYPSEDAYDYWCAKDPERLPATDNIRCAFLAIGS